MSGQAENPETNRGRRGYKGEGLVEFFLSVVHPRRVSPVREYVTLSELVPEGHLSRPDRIMHIERVMSKLGAPLPRDATYRQRVLENLSATDPDWPLG